MNTYEVEMSKDAYEMFVRVQKLIEIRKSLPVKGRFMDRIERIDGVIEELGEEFILLLNE